MITFINQDTEEKAEEETKDEENIKDDDGSNEDIDLGTQA